MEQKIKIGLSLWWVCLGVLRWVYPIKPVGFLAVPRCLNPDKEFVQETCTKNLNRNLNKFLFKFFVHVLLLYVCHGANAENVKQNNIHRNMTTVTVVRQCTAISCTAIMQTVKYVN